MSMTLPEAKSLAAGIASQPTAPKAVLALSQTALQIQSWTTKVNQELEELDAVDDIEWAAAAGRPGLNQIDKYVADFESLISVYVFAIEELQSRDDIIDVTPEGNQAVVEQMEVTLNGWDQVRSNLKKIHTQVELAMEFVELWQEVLGDVARELDSLSDMVFEMEEKRHLSPPPTPPNVANCAVNLNELENALRKLSLSKKTPSTHSSSPPTLDLSPLGSPIIENMQDDSKLMSLFARMAPLKVSLDFLPMRLELYYSRAEEVFPHACNDLRKKTKRLTEDWVRLSKDAEMLRNELNEDRWVVVFRNAGRLAKRMCESVERSITKLREAIDNGYEKTNPVVLARRIESFQAQKMHYGPTVQRVLTIIQTGLKDRVTVNGEIIWLHKDISARAQEMTDHVDAMEKIIDDMNANQNSKLRESSSSTVSAERTFSKVMNWMDGPPSSGTPPSSVELAVQGQEGESKLRKKRSASRLPRPTSWSSTEGPPPKQGSKFRTPSTSRPPPLSSRRSSALPQVQKIPTPGSNYSTTALSRRARSPAPPSIYRQGLYNPPKNPLQHKTPSPLNNKPRWSATINPRSVSSSSSYRKVSPAPPAPKLRSFAERVSSPTFGRPAAPPRAVSVAAGPPVSKSGKRASLIPVPTGRASSLGHRRTDS